MTAARSRPFDALAPLCLLGGFCLFWFADTIADPDLWGHVRFGQDILRTGSIARVNATPIARAARSGSIMNGCARRSSPGSTTGRARGA